MGASNGGGPILEDANCCGLNDKYKSAAPVRHKTRKSKFDIVNIHTIKEKK
jgi:hypothetical protein